jgi:hypothetical protein
MCVTLPLLLMTPGRAILALIVAMALCLSAGAQSVVGELSATDVSVKGGVVMRAGDTRVVSGSEMTAGEATASLRLARGGEVHICPRSSLSITASQNGRELMLALGSGAIETHYSLESSADTVLTPDFRILLAGPGDFHFAVASDTRGNTCVRALGANTSAAIVYELMGDGIFQVRPGEQMLFRNGTVKDFTRTIPPDCGCPVRPQAMRASQAPPVTAPPSLLPPIDSAPVTIPPPARSADEVHVSVDAPFVFRASEPVVPEPPTVARLSLQTLPPLLFAPLPAQPPQPVSAPTSPPQVAKTGTKKGLLGHVRSFFAAIFR